MGALFPESGSRRYSGGRLMGRIAVLGACMFFMTICARSPGCRARHARQLMTIGGRLVVCGAFALLALASLYEANAQSASTDTRWSAAWPKPSESALNLVRLMREDEVVLLAV